MPLTLLRLDETCEGGTPFGFRGADLVGIVKLQAILEVRGGIFSKTGVQARFIRQKPAKTGKKSAN